MFDNYENLTKFFEEKLHDLRCQRDTKAYIIGIYGRYKNVEYDFSKNSITILYSQAKEQNSFFMYQNIGDWLFLTSSMFPESLKYASKEYYNNIAQLSYYRCYKLMKTWKVYEELSDEFVGLTSEIKSKFYFG
jgi:hypothetical protein